MDEKNLNEKVELGIKGSVKVLLNICMFILMLFTIIGSIDIIIEKYNLLEKLITLPILGAAFYGLSVCGNILNSKIEINDDEIIKYSLLNKKKKIGKISDIETYSGDVYVTVYKKEKKFFHYWKAITNNDNVAFYEYLKNNYTRSIVKERNLFLAFLSLGYAIVYIYILIKFMERHVFTTCIVMIFGSIIFFKRYIKEFKIIGNKIIYKNLFCNKKMDISTITKIQYTKRVYRTRGTKCISYNIIGFIEEKRSFKVNDLSQNEFDCLKNITKANKIKLSKK